jgi:hypothetical protein
MIIPKFKPKRTLPKTLGAMSDLGRQLDAERLELEKVIKSIYSELQRYKDHMNELMKAAGVEETHGKLGRATKSTEYVGNVTNWKLLHRHIKKTGEFELLHRRVSTGALTERWEHGKKVPGVERVGIVRIKFGKAKQR